jgi:hypothetical protein
MPRMIFFCMGQIVAELEVINCQLARPGRLDLSKRPDSQYPAFLGSLDKPDWIV